MTIDVAASAAPLLGTTSRTARSVEEHDGRVRTTIRVAQYHGLKRLIAGMPGVAKVVAPAEARAAVAEWAAAGAARYAR